VGQIDNLNAGQIPNILARLAKLERGTPMNNAAIGRGGIEVYDGGVIRITNGGLSVTGKATIEGTLQADGTITFTGKFTQSGPTTFTGETTFDGLTHLNGDTDVTGKLDVDGPMTTTGPLDVEGVTTLKNDLNVTTGKIKAGNVTIDPAHLSGSVKFDNGTYVAATPNGAQLVKPGGGAVTVSAGQADMSVVGGGGVIVDGVGVSLQGLPETSEKPNLYISPGNRLYRSTAVI
jgi:cytoskeletal protein CcmA (bactofilin family)